MVGCPNKYILDWMSSALELVFFSCRVVCRIGVQLGHSELDKILKLVAIPGADQEELEEDLKRTAWGRWIGK